MSSFSRTMIVGIGGTGSKTIRHLLKMIEAQPEKKKLYENHMVSFVAVDTDAKDLERLDISQANKILISEAFDLATYYKLKMEQEAKNPGNEIFTWAPRLEEVGDSFITHKISSGAGQIRYYSRIAVEANIQLLRNKLSSALQQMLQFRTAETMTGDDTIVVCLVHSIAGGTGSGGFIHIGRVIKEIAHGLKVQVIVKSYIFTADIYEQSALLPENQLSYIRANTYACVKEIEAFNLLLAARGNIAGRQAFRVFDESDFVLTYEGAKPANDPSLKKPIDFVYLIDSSNIKGRLPLNKAIGFSAYEHMLADALLCSVFSPQMADKMLSTENNNIYQSIKASVEGKPDPMYGILGAARMVFPVEDIAKYLGSRFLQEIICHDWETLDNRFFNEMKAKQKREREGIFDNENPLRHRHFIDTLETIESRPNPIPQFAKAVREYRQLGDEGFWYTAIEDELFHLVKKNLADNLNLMDRNSQVSSVRFRKMDALRTDALMQEIENSPKDQVPSILRNYIQDTEAIRAKIEGFFKSESDKIARSLVNDIISTSFKSLGGAQEKNLPKFKLQYWFAIDSATEGKNIFYLRYLLSRQLDYLQNQLREATRLKEEYDHKRKISRKRYVTETIPDDGHGGAISYINAISPGFLSLFRNPIKEFILGKGDQVPLPDFLRNWVLDTYYYYYHALRENVLKELIGFIGYPGISHGQHYGLLNIIHGVADFMIHEYEAEVKKQAEVYLNNNESVDNKGAVVAVYCDADSKKNIWNHLNTGDISGSEEFRQTYQNFRNAVLTYWNKYLDIFSEVLTPEARKNKENDWRDKFHRDLKDALKEPSIFIMEKRLRERYNIFLALQEWTEEVKGIAARDAQIKAIDEQFHFLSQMAQPYAIIDDTAKGSAISVIGYAPELKKYGIDDYIARAHSGASGSGTAEIDDLQIILMYKIRTGLSINEYRSIPQYKVNYDDNPMMRHIDRRWAEILPEPIIAFERAFLFEFVMAMQYQLLRCHDLNQGAFEINLNFDRRETKNPDWAEIAKSHKKSLQKYRNYSRMTKYGINLRKTLAADTADLRSPNGRELVEKIKSALDFFNKTVPDLGNDAKSFFNHLEAAFIEEIRIKYPTIAVELGLKHE